MSGQRKDDGLACGFMSSAMKNILSILIVGLCLLASCATEKPLYIRSEKNHYYTKKCVKKLAKKNGNAVGFMSYMANFSYVLSYGDSFVDIYKITIVPNGKRRLHKQTISLSSPKNLLFCQDSIISAEQEYFSKYSRMMDGDYLLCRYKQDGQWRQDVLGMQFRELLRGDYHSAFLRQISNDMNVYQIWTQFYK